MYCSYCDKDVDINSVSQTNITGGSVKGFSYDSPYSEFSPTSNSVSLTSESKLINVCKSCGQTGYLFTSRESLEAQLQAKERAEAEAARQEEIRARTPLPKSHFWPPIGKGIVCLLSAGVCLWVMQYLMTEEDKWGKIVMPVGILAFGGSALYWFFWDLSSLIADNNQRKRNLRAFQNQASQMPNPQQQAPQLNVPQTHQEPIQEEPKQYSPDQSEYYMPQGSSDEEK